MAADGRRRAGELEAAVLHALWDAGIPLAPARIHAALGTRLAYNTVHTVLTRMCDKGVLVRVRRDGHPAYRPARTRTEHEADQLRALLDNAHDRHALLLRFVDMLRPGDEAELRALLRDTQPPGHPPHG